MGKHSIALVRHGDYQQRSGVPSALQPYPLNSLGEVQAAEAANIIQVFARSHDLTIHSVIDCSPLLRSWQTAQIIADSIDPTAISLCSYPDLIERSVGSVANLTKAEIEQAIESDPRFDTPPNDWKTNSSYCLPFVGAESLMQAGARVAQHIQRYIAGLSSESNVDANLKLFVGHGASLRHAAHLLGILEFEDVAKLSMYHAHPIIYEVGNQCLKHVEGRWKIRESATGNKLITRCGAQGEPFTD